MMQKLKLHNCKLSPTQLRASARVCLQQIKKCAMDLITVFILLAISLLLCFWWMSSANYWEKRGFPSAKCNFPFGSMKGVGAEKPFHERLDDFYREHKDRGPAVGFYQFLKPLLVITSPKLLKEMMVTNFEHFQNRYLYYNHKDDPLSAHLLSLEGEQSCNLNFLFTFLM